MRAYLSIGSNMGERGHYLQEALLRLAAKTGIKIVRLSQVYETSPWGYAAQREFWNQAVELDTILEPLELLRACQEVEASLGRQRTTRWGPRTIDIDILLYDNRTSNTAELVLPHPRLEERAFVLGPLREIAPDLILPSGRSIQEVFGEGDIKPVRV